MLLKNPEVNGLSESKVTIFSSTFEYRSCVLDPQKTCPDLLENFCDVLSLKSRDLSHPFSRKIIRNVYLVNVDSGYASLHTMHEDLNC